jgi:hypothetical protein
VQEELTVWGRENCQESHFLILERKNIIRQFLEFGDYLGIKLYFTLHQIGLDFSEPFKTLIQPIPHLQVKKQL